MDKHIEKNYDFKSQLLSIHKKNFRDYTLIPTDNEFVIKNGVSIITDWESAVVYTATRDFIDYLFVSMGISALLTKDGEKNGNITISLSKDLGEADGYMGYRITVNDGILLEAHDERGAAQGLYYLEDLMNIRHAPYLKHGTVERKALFSPRITQSPFGMYEYPDEAFSWITHMGYDAIELWLRDYCTDKRGYYIDVPLICERAKKYGIDVYAEIYTPHNMHPDEEGAQEFYDSIYEKLFKACPDIKGFTLTGESTQFVSRDPNVGKTPYSANFEENIPTGKTSPGWWPCSDYPAWVEMIQRSARKAKPDVDIIFCTYNWGYAPKKDRVQLIENLPDGISLMATWDMFHQYKLGNSVEDICDYSLSFVGPGEYFTSEAIAAKKRGLRLYSISNTSGRTWDFGVVPYEPMPQQWIKRYKLMQKAHREWGLCGLVENIHYGFHPSMISELEKQAFFTEVKPLEEVLLDILKRDYGEAFESVISATELFSEAITHYVPTNEDQYGGFRIGPSYPFWSTVLEGLPATIPGKGKKPSRAHAMFGNGIYYSIYTPDTDGKNSLPGVRIYDELDSFKKMEELMNRGIAELEKVNEKNHELKKLICLAKFIRNSVHTVINIKKHYILKQELSIAKTNDNASNILKEMECIILDEQKNAEDTIPLVRFDSRLGWEPSMDYTTDEEALRWKIRQLDYELNIKFPTYKKAISLKK